jgi:histone-lysine N-methyltransferase SETMAR
MDQKLYIRALLLHYWKKKLSPPDAANEICKIEQGEVVKERNARNWFDRFDAGNFSLDDEPRSGRPPTIDPEVVRQAAEANPCTSTRILSAELGCSNATVHRKLTELDMVNRRCRVIPHELTPDQAQRRVDVCRQLLERRFGARDLRRIVTSDEKWIFYRNPDTRNQWTKRGVARQPVAKHGRFENKVMLCVWWNSEGPIHFEFVPDGQAVNAELYRQQLDRMYAALTRKYPALVNRSQVLLHHDNAPAHTARSTLDKLQELDGIELLPHPAYSPDLAPSDYHLFRSMAHFLRGRTFKNVEEVETGVRDFFASKQPEWYRAGIENLAERWLQTIDHNGLYFED